MPYDTNNMFGVLADSKMMRNLKCRGRSKQFEKEIAEEVVKEQQDAIQIANAEKIAIQIDAELERLKLLEDTEDENYDLDDRNEADQAVNADMVTLANTPVARRIHHQTLDTTPLSTHSGKPLHRRRRDQEAVASSTSTTESHPLPQSPCPTPAEQPRELFVFTNKNLYSQARALFAMTSQPDHPANLRWSHLASLLTSPPISCHVIPARNGGASVTIVRPARTKIVGGEEVVIEKRSVVLHRPHGGAQAWVERHVLENMAGSQMGKFGWERGDFVFEGK